MKTPLTTIASLLLLLGLSSNVHATGGKTAKEIKKEAPRNIGKLNVSEFTSAELQIVEQRSLDASTEEVWSFIGDSRKLPLYVKQIKKVTLHSDNATADEQGDTRVCNFGGTDLTEQIVYVQPEKIYAYQAADNELVSNHLGVITLEEQDGKTLITWYQYFDKGSKKFKAAMMKKMMPGVLNKGMKNIEKEVNKI